jgi:hypothetical protein
MGRKTDILLQNFGTFLNQVLLEQRHQEVEFGLGTFPIFRLIGSRAVS